MTLRRETSSIDSPHARPQLTPRLRLKPKGSAVGHVDGAWWPHSEELPAELPDLLAVLSVRLGQIGRVSYSFADWSTAPNTLATGDNTVGLRGYYQQQGNTIQVVGIDNAKLVLLVVPSRTESGDAHEIMMSAAAPDNKATVDELLHD